MNYEIWQENTRVAVFLDECIRNTVLEYLNKIVGFELYKKEQKNPCTTG